MNNIKAKIQELVPEVMEDKCNCLHCTYPVHRDFTQPITLAVVLRAIKKIPDREWQIYSQIINKWNLAQDNYDNQTRETQLFIGSLLGVEK